MTNSLRRIAAVIAVPAALTFALTACGGESGHGRPSTADLTKALSDKSSKVASDLGVNGLSDSAIKCVAQAFEDSKLSDDTLRAIVNDDEDFKGKGGDDAAINDVGTKVGTCISNG